MSHLSACHTLTLTLAFYVHVMVITTVLADCETCEQEVEAKILDCDECFIAFQEAGNKPEDWSDLMCDHLQCLECGERLT